MPKIELSVDIFRGGVTGPLGFPHPEIAQIFTADVLAALASARTCILGTNATL